MRIRRNSPCLMSHGGELFLVNGHSCSYVNFLQRLSWCLRRSPHDQKSHHQRSACVLQSDREVQMVFKRHSDVRDITSSSFHFSALMTPFPRQNNVYDLYSLIKFLGIEQFSDKKMFDEWIGIPITKDRDAGPALQRLQVRDTFHQP